MKINRYLLPVIALTIFFLVIALGVAAGYWQTHGGGRHGGHGEVLWSEPIVRTLDGAGL